MKTKINPIKMARRNMANDALHENPRSASRDPSDAVSAIVLLSRRIGNIEIQISEIKDKLGIK